MQAVFGLELIAINGFATFESITTIPLPVISVDLLLFWTTTTPLITSLLEISVASLLLRNITTTQSTTPFQKSQSLALNFMQPIPVTIPPLCIH
ncbi:hypothetical protein CEXT_208171 [Caerostris extrusa]|uniref:Uncharacterized protein n=1 Tax=Caerostris extrusa TaxID=172846 RepID=A0AAV4S2X5_CAEEX|nr:hypothetical protein CEXT_208171 [Caerostris extrusa]